MRYGNPELMPLLMSRYSTSPRPVIVIHLQIVGLHFKASWAAYSLLGPKHIYIFALMRLVLIFQFIQSNNNNNHNKDNNHSKYNHHKHHKHLLRHLADNCGPHSTPPYIRYLPRFLPLNNCAIQQNSLRLLNSSIFLSSAVHLASQSESPIDLHESC